MWCVAPVAGTYDATAWIHPRDRHLLADPMAGHVARDQRDAARRQDVARSPSPTTSASSPTRQELELAGLTFVVDHTPGHTEGSVTFRSAVRRRRRRSPRCMFSGDLLFAGSIGRTDLPGGDHPTMLRSLADKVLPLADDIVVLPGHGEQTSIGRERATNPYLLDLRGRPGESPEAADPWHQDHPAERVPRAAARARVVEREVIDSLARTFELHGFANIETRAVEPLDLLGKGGDVDKEIYLLGGSRRTEDDTATPGSACTSTSRCRSPATCSSTPVTSSSRSGATRSSRPGAGSGRRSGRYRQFTQADVDIVGRDVLPFHHDVEVMRVMVEALDALPAAAAELPVQQPQADPGLLPRPRPPRRRGRDPHHRQARQAARRDAVAQQLTEMPAPRAEQAEQCLTSPPSAPPTPRSSTRSARSACRTTCSTRASPSSPPSSRAAPRASGATSRSRPTCASRAASTTTPAPSSRSSWPATSA